MNSKPYLVVVRATKTKANSNQIRTQEFAALHMFGMLQKGIPLKYFCTLPSHQLSYLTQSRGHKFILDTPSSADKNISRHSLYMESNVFCWKFNCLVGTLMPHTLVASSSYTFDVTSLINPRKVSDYCLVLYLSTFGMINMGFVFLLYLTYLV